MKFIKKNIGAIIVIVIIILIALGIYYVKEEFYSTDSGAIYGNRLEGRDAVKITSERKNQVKDSLKEETESVSIRVQGKIVYVSITVNGETSLDSAKNIGNKTLESFSDEEKSYYDFQIIIEKKSDSNQFPIIGYKHYTKSSLTWTKDRAES